MKSPYKENEMKSYEQYAKRIKAEAESEYKESLAAIAAKQTLMNTGGALAETLSETGLSESGYSEYLKQKDSLKIKSEKDQAIKELYEAEANAYSGYAEYVNNYETIQKTAKEKFISELIKDGVYDVEDAKRRATASGLSEENARETAELGVLIARKQAISSAVKYAKEKNYSYKGTRYYALSLGLSDEDATRVAESVSRISEEEAKKYESLDKDAYFDLIKKSVNSD